jgi:AcrR family transcriptional regulator
VIERAAATSSPDARLRIVDAGVRCIARDGVAAASMAAIAIEAGVSKALLHYHYHDRSRLLAEIVEQIGVRTIERERTAIDESHRLGGLDALWQ